MITPFVNERGRRPIGISPQKNVAAFPHAGALSAIRDLDFDFQTGKVSQEDYETLRVRLVVEAGEYLQAKQQEGEKIEAMIRTRHQVVKASVKCAKCGERISPQDLFCRSCGTSVKDQAASGEPVVRFSCPGCGKSVKEADLFCPACGTPLIENATA